MHEKNWTKNLALLLFGLLWILVGIKTLFKPIYYFRGALVDFTGYNVLAGSALVAIGVTFIAMYYHKPK